MKDAVEVADQAVVYVTTNALASPHVQSQVLPYMRALAGDVEFWLITGESQRGLASFRRLGPNIRTRGVYRRPGAAGALANTMRFIAAIRDGLRLAGNQAILHARSHVAALYCSIAAGWLARRWIFDMRGFYVDELLDMKRLRENSLRHAALNIMERKLVRSAHGLVSLTEQAANVLLSEYGVSQAQPLAVIPCGVDVEHYRPQTDRKTRQAGGAIRLVYAGSLGPRYMPNEMARFFVELMRVRPGSTWTVASRQDGAAVATMVAELGGNPQAVSVTTWAPEEVSAQLPTYDLSLMFVPAGRGTAMSSSIKIAESLSCGIPVVATTGWGDIERLIELGVVRAYDPSDVAGSVEKAAVMVDEPNVGSNCRSCAESQLAVPRLARRYQALYARVLALK